MTIMLAPQSGFEAREQPTPPTTRRMVVRAARYGDGSVERTLGSMLLVCIEPAGVAVVTPTRFLALRDQDAI